MFLLQNKKSYEPHVSVKARLIRYSFSFSVVLFMVCLVLAVVVGVIIYRVSLRLAFPTHAYLHSITAACINLIFIYLFSYLYYWLATKLTDMGKSLFVTSLF